MRGSLMLLSGWLGCSTPDPAPHVSATSATSPPITDPGAPFVLPPNEDIDAGIDLDALIAAANDAIALVSTIEPDPVLLAYRDLASGAEPGCPTMYADGDVDYWLDTCTASSGTSFDGFGIDDTLLIDDGYSVYSVEATGGTAYLEDASGTWLEIDGFVQRIDSGDEFVTSSTLLIAGRFDTNHPFAANSWLQDGLKPNFNITTYDINAKRAAYFVTGALDQLGGDYTAIAFDGCGVVDDTLGYGGCAAEPSGVVSMRTSSGSWVDIVFDPVGDAEGIVIEDFAQCDGCGHAWDRDRDLGIVCLDFAPWLP